MKISFGQDYWKMMLVVVSSCFIVGTLIESLGLPGYMVGIILGIFTILGLYFLEISFKLIGCLLITVGGISLPYMIWSYTNFEAIMKFYFIMVLSFIGLQIMYFLIRLSGYQEQPEPEEEQYE